MIAEPVSCETIRRRKRSLVRAPLIGSSASMKNGVP